MIQIFHRTGALIATLSIFAFLIATLNAEFFGTLQDIQQVKAAILLPGLIILIPAMVMTGASGFVLAKSRGGPLVAAKKNRMRYIGIIGLTVLIPCAFLLNHWASLSMFGPAFYAVQMIELIAGAVNVILATLNIWDGFRLSGRFHKRTKDAASL